MFASLSVVDGAKPAIARGCDVGSREKKKRKKFFPLRLIFRRYLSMSNTINCMSLERNWIRLRDEANNIILSRIFCGPEFFFSVMCEIFSC